MAKKSDATPWQDLEAQAYHAYREWHLWLVLRERELAQRLGAMKSPPKSDEREDEGYETATGR